MVGPRGREQIMPKRNIIWVVAIVTAGLVAFWAMPKRPAQVAFWPMRDQPVRANDADGERFRPVEETYRLIRNRYYLPVEEDKLERAAVEGMVEALDPFSAYVPPEQAEAIQRRVTDGFARGVGLHLQRIQGHVTIVGVLVNSPAHERRLFPGDEIVAIDGRDVGDLPLSEVEGLLAGPMETKVTLAVLGRPEPVTLTRSEFPLETVEGLYRDEDGRWVYHIDPGRGLAYVRIKELVGSTAPQFRSIFTEFDMPRGLVLDLRDNPGGMLNFALQISDMFLREGLIVTTVGRDGKPERKMAHSHGTYPEIPIVVLINGGTASAAEIVCGSLHLHNRAVLVGTRTRGKGCVQEILPLTGGLGKIILTTSQFYLGRYGSIARQPGSDKWGVDPHVQVILLPSRQQQLDRLRERAGGLRPPQPATSVATQPRRDEKVLGEFLTVDSQLAQAVQLLTDPVEMQAILQKAAEQARSAEKVYQDKAAEK